MMTVITLLEETCKMVCDENLLGCLQICYKLCDFYVCIGICVCVLLKCLGV